MVVTYWVARFCSAQCKENIISNLWAVPVLVLYRLIAGCLPGHEIQAAVSIGHRSTAHHGYGVVINKNVVAGDDFTLRHDVTIGNLGANDPSCPVTSNDVELGASVTLLDGATIGDNMTIGAGSVAMSSAPDNALVADEKTRVKVIE